ncbi:MAG: type II toxin-antitoxin system HicB family antitoxin [Bacteroidales bacterium]|nr:type II toxin-antitoxin system HicB family antitoxin [Bacteroidales bacterium]
MNTLKYKGYIGSVAYSEPDKVFFGKLEGIDALVNYEGESVAELTASFREAVDDYLAFCQDLGQKPEKSYSGAFNVRIAPSLHRDIANLAAEAGISLNAFVKRALSEAVKHPWVESGSLVTGYGAEMPEPAMLMEPGGPQYGTREQIKLYVPHKDAAFAKDLARRMGWELKEDSHKN